MTFRQTIRHLWHKPGDAWYYWQGEIRYWLYQRCPALIRPHIRTQYEWRKKRAEPCYQNGECLVCHCRTPELFFADKSCAKSPPCYPVMMNRNEWRNYSDTQV
ncbi:hypothetical protein [Spirosoma sordidisoli]|uniref:Uncharacterized protein n=1 Tax=Spirosoma sordidisoli TaxID=2502893 RepID=A0A4Q2UM50_9BACT|nr:hypothetical protein [Spirosoma sordidisoli]RYC70663.1 hypothetical protein EQG79_00495 [Spirosoma sordidisoli]